jgi:4-hydroxy-3-polyprenylbenzoate decarboxylase
MHASSMRLVVGISGASGAIYGIRTLQALKTSGVETHLIVSDGARKTIALETDFSVSRVSRIATKTYEVDDLAASLASGSFLTDGMVIAPCSMKTLGGIATGFSDNLLLRAADVTLKENRPLVLMIRETPLSLIHLQNMVRVASAGATVLPAMPSFYSRPTSVDALVDQMVGKVMDVLGIENHLSPRWRHSSSRMRTTGRPR